MTRRRIIGVLFVVAAVALLAWIASRTYIASIEIPTPLRGEARTNPFYAAERFARALGAEVKSERVFSLPGPDGILVLSTWHWNLSASRRQRIEQWVEQGGRLVADASMVGREGPFESWSAIESKTLDTDEIEKLIDKGELDVRNPCQSLVEQPARGGRAPKYTVCELRRLEWFVTRKPVAWGLRNTVGLQVIRVAIGRGSVTLVNGLTFTYRSLFDGDHGQLFAAATQLRRGDVMHFLTEDTHPSLLSLLWLFGAPVVTLGLMLVGAGLWRGAIRLGPLSAPPDRARRSLAEQIRGTGQFALRHGGGASLHAATLRAMNDAANRRINGYSRLSPGERVSALAALAGCDPEALRRAMETGAPRRPQELRTDIATLESVRRSIAADRHTHHGTH